METFNQIKEAVHKPINFKDFESSFIKENTNCFALAIGSTVPAGSKFYRLGMLSKEKNYYDDYNSPQELKKLFISDVKALGLKIEELNIVDKSSISNVPLKNNEHIAILFVQQITSGKVIGFHFLRFDKNGWSEKKGYFSFLINENVKWPTNNCIKLIGCFKITR